MLHKTSVGLDEARSIVQTILETARARHPGKAISVAVVDDAGLLVHFSRMDGAHSLTVRLSQNKALTAVDWKKNTKDIGSYLQKEGKDISWYGDPAREAAMGGGVLIRLKDSSIAGAVGVSGGTTDEDHDLAAAGAAVVQH